jgi:hypothetical protein
MATKWIEVNIPFGPVYNEELTDGPDGLFPQLDSFEKRGLNVPGTLIELQDGRQYLIGDILSDRDSAGEWQTAFEARDIVKRYKVVFRHKKVKA